MGYINIRNKASVKSFVGVYYVEVDVKSRRCGRVLVGRREPVGLEKPFRSGDLGRADVRSASSAKQHVRLNIGLTRAPHLRRAMSRLWGAPATREAPNNKIAR